jgi:hypothetical protein
VDPTSIRRSTTLLAAYRRRRFAALFASVLLTFGAGGPLEELAPGLNPLHTLLALNLLAAVASVAHEGTMRPPLTLAVAYLIVRALLAPSGSRRHSSPSAKRCG